MLLENVTILWANDLLVRHCTQNVHFARIHSSFDGSERISCCPDSAIMFDHDPTNVKS